MATVTITHRMFPHARPRGVGSFIAPASFVLPAASVFPQHVRRGLGVLLAPGSPDSNFPHNDLRRVQWNTPYTIDQVASAQQSSPTTTAVSSPVAAALATGVTATQALADLTQALNNAVSLGTLTSAQVQSLSLSAQTMTAAQMESLAQQVNALTPATTATTAASATTTSSLSTWLSGTTTLLGSSWSNSTLLFGGVGIAALLWYLSSQGKGKR